MRAALVPPFAWRRTRMRPSRAAYSAAMSPDPSLDPSSTQTSSQSAKVCAITLSSAAPMKDAPLYAGMTTDISGSTIWVDYSI